MREFVGVSRAEDFATEESRDVWRHLHQEFGEDPWYHCWDRHCCIPVPKPGVKFEVIEPLEICNSSNIHRGAVLPVGKYEVMEVSGGFTSHTIRLRNLETGEELGNPIYTGYTDESMLDWRGIRRID